MIAEEYAQLAKFYRQADKLEPDTVPADQWAWLNDRMSAITTAQGAKPVPLNQTDMIARRARHRIPF